MAKRAKGGRRKTAQQIWDGASLRQRAAWLRDTGSWTDDARLTWKQMMAQGGSQADVTADQMKRIARGEGR